MKPKSPPPSLGGFSSRAALAIVVCFSGQAMGRTDNFWNGSESSDWNTGANWSEGVIPTKNPGNQHAVINSNSPYGAAITVGIIPPVDIIIARGAGAIATLKHGSGDAATGGDNWMFVGHSGGDGIYNLAGDAGDGALTGLAQGSGNMTVGGRLYVGGAFADGGTGVVNVRTSGGLAIGNDLVIGSAGGTGVMKIDSGTVTTGGWNFIGKDEGGTGANGALCLSGGSLTNNGSRTYLGLGNTTGKIEMSGGSYSNVAGGNDTFLAIGVLNLANPASPSISMTGGTLNVARRLSVGGMDVGNDDNNAAFIGPGKGRMTINGAEALVNATGEFWVGQGAGSNGNLTLTHGTIQSGSWVVIGRGGGAGTVSMTGGSWNKTGDSNFIVGASGSGITSIMNMSGGTVTVAGSDVADRGITWIGEGNGVTGILNLSGTADFSTTRMTLGEQSGANGAVNLTGGTLRVARITGGAGNATFNFNGGRIVATAANGSFITGLASAALGAGHLRIDSGGFNLTVPQKLTGVGGIVKTGAGTLDLTGGNTFAGACNVGEGKLATTTAATTTGAVTLANDTAFGLTRTVDNAVFSASGFTFGSSGDTTFDIDLGSFPGNSTNAPLRVNGSGTLVLNGTVTVNITDAFPAMGAAVPLISYTGPKGGSGHFELGPLPDGMKAVLNDDLANLVSLDVTRVNDAYWTGEANNEWDTGTSTNWKDDYSEAPSTFADGDPVMFDDRVGTGPTNVLLDSVVAPGDSGVAFNNIASNYSLSGAGSISGPTGLLKQGAGSLDLFTANDYTGVTTLSGGATNANLLANGGIASSIGAAPASGENLILNGGTLNYTGATTAIDRGFTVTGSNSGIGVSDAGATLTMGGSAFIAGGNLTKTGPGTLKLTYDGINFMGAASPGLRANGGILVLAGLGSRSNTIGGELWVGSAADVPAHLMLDNTSLAAGGLIALGRGNGVTGVTSTLTATDSTITSGSFSTGFNGGNELNDAGQTVTLSNTVWTNNGLTFLAENAGSTTVMTLTNDSEFNTNNTMLLARFGTTSHATLTLSGSSSITRSGGYTSIGNEGTGILNLEDDASFTCTTADDFNVSDVGASNGTLNIGDNATFSAQGIVFVGKNTGTTGTVHMTGGTINTNNYITVGRGTGSSGTFNISGGTVNQTDPDAGIVIGENGTGVLNMTGGAIHIGGGGLYLTAETVGTGNATVNLDGGTITAKRVVERDFHAGNISSFHFNGGLLKAASGANPAFMTGLDAAYVDTNGAFIDTNGHDIAIGQALIEGTGGGGFTKAGSGTLLLNGVNTYTGATTVSAGTLGGTGSIAGALSVASGASVAPGASTGVFTVSQDAMFDAGSSLVIEIDESQTPDNDLLAVTGNLDIAGASLVVVLTGESITLPYTIATFGSRTGTFASVTPEMTLSYHANSITITAMGSPFSNWISTFTSIPAEDRDPEDDPDGDGRTNIAEFALDGNPALGASTGKVVGKVANVGGNPSLVLTLPVRNGAVFSGATEQVSALIDGVIYRIQGSDELANWNLAVSEVTDVDDKTAIEGALPVINTGWTYRTFQGSGSSSGDPADFLRAVIENP